MVSRKKTCAIKKSLKYFLGNDDNDVIRPLGIKFPQIIGYVKYFDSNKTMSFKVSDKKLLKKYTKIWGRVSSLIGKEFDSKHVQGGSDKNIQCNNYQYFPIISFQLL